jgi:hypothetical protein
MIVESTIGRRLQNLAERICQPPSDGICYPRFERIGFAVSVEQVVNVTSPLHLQQECFSWPASIFVD